MAAAPSPVKYKHGARGATDESSVISLLGLENAALAPQLEGCPATVHVACRRAARWVSPTLAEGTARFFCIERPVGGGLTA